MNFLSKVFDLVNHNYLKKIRMKTFKLNEFSIFCNTCIGGVIYHRTGRRFTSPFINCWLTSYDFIKFLKKSDYYLDLPLKFTDRTNFKFPIGKLKDLTIYFNHYKSENDALECWERRKKRIVDSQIVIIRESPNHIIQETDVLMLEKKFKKIIVLTERNVSSKFFKVLKYKKNEKDFSRNFLLKTSWERQWDFTSFLLK